MPLPQENEKKKNDSRNQVEVGPSQQKPENFPFGQTQHSKVII
jgi:hypothetical protein